LGCGTINQADIPGGGTQCTYISVAFLCLATNKEIELEKPAEIDEILRDGTLVIDLIFLFVLCYGT